MIRNSGMKHGLFGCLVPGTPLTEFRDWRDVAQLVYRNSRKHITMYRSVISFDETTAKELFLTDQKAWQRYIENHIRTIAEENGIRREHFQWAAAVHKEKGHPHIHVVFWDSSDARARIRNPFTHPSIPGNIRKRMTRDTFADRIRAYGEEKNKAAADMRKISDELVEDFERHIRQMGRRKYQKLRKEYDLDQELSMDFDFSDTVLGETADRIFRLKSSLPPTGRIAYQFLSPELKKQTDELVLYLLSQIPELQTVKSDYVESKMKMVYLYGGSEEYFASQRRKFEEEADRIIANRILGMVKVLNRLDQEGREAEYLHNRRRYYMEQMILEMLDMLSTMTASSCQQREATEKIWSGELSKEARKELYLRSQDKGYEH